jgi:hypothetical protein
MAQGVFQFPHDRGGGVVDRRPAAGRSNIEHEHKWILSAVEPNVDQRLPSASLDHPQTVAADPPTVKRGRRRRQPPPAVEWVHSSGHPWR